MKTLFSLEGKTALVTGGSRGIGRAAALGLAMAGADIIVVSRTLPDLEKVVTEVEALGRKCSAIAAHIGRIEEVNNLVQTAVSKSGKIDILVNNAATSPTITPAIEVDERLWDSIMNLNLKGLFFLSQSIAKIMKEHGGGTIINVASSDAFKPEVNVGVYSITKAAVVMATKVMAVEWAQYKIRVNGIAPGNVHTRLRDSGFAAIPGWMEDYLKRTPLGRIAEPEDLVGGMVFLASDASNYMTGQTIIVDGGLLLT